MYGTEGYVEVEGLGGSYGTEKLHYCPKKYFKPFEVTTTEFRGGDNSWLLEWKEFASAIKEKRTPLGSAEDGIEPAEGRVGEDRWFHGANDTGRDRVWRASSSYRRRATTRRGGANPGSVSCSSAISGST